MVLKNDHCFISDHISSIKVIPVVLHNVFTFLVEDLDAGKPPSSCPAEEKDVGEEKI